MQIASALALATGRAPRLAATVLAASLVPTTLAGHRFWEESDPTAAGTSASTSSRTSPSSAASCSPRSTPRAGPAMAWRTKHAVGDVRREAKHLRREAKAQARLAAKSVTS